MNKNKVDLNLIMDLLRSQNKEEIELYNFVNLTMYEVFGLCIADSHDLVLQLEEQGKIKIIKSYDGYTFDNYDKKVSQYNYMIVIKE